MTDHPQPTMDLVEHLRDHAYGWARDLLHSAADEIERLRSENERLHQVIDDHGEATGRNCPT